MRRFHSFCSVLLVVVIFRGYLICVAIVLTCLLYVLFVVYQRILDLFCALLRCTDPRRMEMEVHMLQQKKQQLRDTPVVATANRNSIDTEGADAFIADLLG